MQRVKLDLSIEDVNLVLEALGNLPFARVYSLVGKIQEQAAQQIKAEQASKTEAAPGPAAALKPGG